jgi:hypothetical protein
VYRGEINPRGIEEEQTTEAMRKRKSGQCQEVKTWEKQAPDTPTTEGNQTSREAHKKPKGTLCGVREGQAAKFFEEDGNHKRGSRPSLEASAGNF